MKNKILFLQAAHKGGLIYAWDEMAIFSLLTIACNLANLLKFHHQCKENFKKHSRLL
jgi:hypothetical protein